MKKKIIFKDLGTVAYSDAYKIQSDVFEATIKNKLSKQSTQNKLFFVEHPHVYTLGKSGDSSNLIISKKFLEQINATYYQTDRGGDITYHGFGQIVIYPIFDLNNFDIMVRKYIFSIEEVIIRTLKEYGISASRIDKASGIWLTEDRKMSEKICALGVRVSHGVTMHGLAFNINTNLDYFNYINPCGFTDKGVTSLQKELGKKISEEEVKKILVKYFNQVFGEL